jgi:hypothetical protein
VGADEPGIANPWDGQGTYHQVAATNGSGAPGTFKLSVKLVDSACHDVELLDLFLERPDVIELPMLDGLRFPIEPSLIHLITGSRFGRERASLDNQQCPYAIRPFRKLDKSIPTMPCSIRDWRQRDGFKWRSMGEDVPPHEPTRHIR